MISSKEITKMVKKKDKKIGKDAIKRIREKLIKEAEELIKKSARNADFAGRRIIKREDFE